MSPQRIKENWTSHLGVILAVAGSAVGLGNFLRFPGQAAQYGGGAFMIAYVVSFLIIGLPICWAEWTLGRHGGKRGFNSCPGIFNAICRNPAAKYLGVIGVIIPVVIYMYYVYIEAWCLGYAVNFLRGAIDFDTVAESTAFWATFIGVEKDGSAIGFGWTQVGGYLLFVFVLNFILIYRGVAKGIEWFCKLALPTLIIIGLVVLVRVLTLGTPDEAHPDRNVNNGLGFMWNPTKVYLEVKDDETGAWTTERELVGTGKIDDTRTLAAQDDNQRIVEVSLWKQFRNPQLWLAAAGQIFFSLSVGFGVIITYASYLKENDDIVLSGLSATSTNEFCEIALGGLITLPAAVAFIGVAGVAGVGLGTFDLGFKVLPMVFSEMPFGQFFGFLFFFLLFLAAVTSSLSMLQPGIAFLEEALKIDRKRSVALLGLITALGCGFVVWFSADAKALDTLDFWVGTFLIFILATIQIILFSWVFGAKRGLEEAHQGSSIRIPAIFEPIMRIVCPVFLITIFVVWLLFSAFGLGSDADVSSYIKDLFITPNRVAWMSIGLVLVLATFFIVLVSRVQRYRDYHPSTPDNP